MLPEIRHQNDGILAPFWSHFEGPDGTKMEEKNVAKIGDQNGRQKGEGGGKLE